MTKDEIQRSLYTVDERLHTGSVSQDMVRNSAGTLMTLVVEAYRLDKNDCADEIQHALALLHQVSACKTNDKFYDHVDSFISYVSGKYDDYLRSIEIFIRKYVHDEGSFSYESAFNNFFDVWENVNNDRPDREQHRLLEKFHAILKKWCPDTAFERYMRYYRSTTSNLKIKEKYLIRVLEKDDKWAAAYEDLGNIRSEKKDWENAAQYYAKAISTSDREKTDSLYYCLAWSYGNLKDYKNEETAYRKCLEIDPESQYANNNLGYCLMRRNRYEEALTFLDKSIGLGTDKYFPYRNKFDALKKMGRKAEALELASAYPQYFNTKHYRDKILKISRESPDLSDVFSKLNEVTESDFAGKIIVADGNSGIELYPHQRYAIRKMDQVILNASDYAGLLVLPTGGGKTLTAAYWLMHNILDKGKKVIWVAHRHELLDQAKSSFEKVCYRDITENRPSYNWRIISGRHDKPIYIKPTDDIIIASKNSLMHGMDHFIKSWLNVNGDNTFLIIDEAHHATAGEYRGLIENIRSNSKSFRMLGLTATPLRTADNEKGLLKKVFPDDIVYKIDLRELINRGIISEPIFKHIPTDVNMVELFKANNSQEALERIAQDSFFDIDSIGNEIAAAIAGNSKRNNAIVNEYVKNKDTYKQTIVFALNINMAIALNGLFNASGVRSDFVVSNIKDMATNVTISSEENKIKVQKFRDGQLDVLINVNILTEGVDLPKVQSVFLTRPTKSTIFMTQMIGRALRGEKAGGTKEAYIVSFIDDWQDKIAWANPEQLFINENIDFNDKNWETQKMAMRLVSIAKIEEFAKIANETIDPRLSDIAFIDRIPIGIYKFSYLVKKTEDEETEKNCNVLVYDCMKNAYDQLLAWLPTADLDDVEKTAEHVDKILFGSLDLLLGYSKQDVADIINYYKQTQEIPQMIYLSERKDYDITAVARHVIDNPSAKKEYIESEWNRSDKHWSAFFGINNQKAFRKLIDDTVDQIEYPEDYAKPEIEPLTEKEKVQVQELSLYEIRRRFPELEEKIRNAVFEKFTDTDGFYHSAQSDFKSKNRLDFQIDHITPVSRGGLTVLDNLQLLTRSENMKKGNK